MVRISIARFGKVSQVTLNKIVSAMSECYERLGPPMNDHVDLYVFEKSEAETFFATADALGGRPRICVYLDKFLELPERVSLAGIRRQAAHSILHGSLEFYVIKFPPDLIRAMRRYNLPQEWANNFLYGIGMAAKEYEVTDLLYSKNFVQDQVAYAKYILQPSGEDILAWEIASRDKLEKILHLTSIIRDVSCAIPLTGDEKFWGEIKECIGKKMAHIALDCRSRIQRIVYKRFPLLAADTMGGINLISKAVVEEIIDYELSEYL
jgi:hypothetical protein